METTHTHNLIEVVEYCKQLHLTADIVGRWVWVTFAVKPSDEIRQSLKDFGFRWSRRRNKWAHNCGHPTRPGKINPYLKYGHKRIQTEEEAAA